MLCAKKRNSNRHGGQKAHYNVYSDTLMNYQL